MINYLASAHLTCANLHHVWILRYTTHFPTCRSLGFTTKTLFCKLLLTRHRFAWYHIVVYGSTILVNTEMPEPEVHVLPSVGTVQCGPVRHTCTQYSQKTGTKHDLRHKYKSLWHHHYRLAPNMIWGTNISHYEVITCIFCCTVYALSQCGEGGGGVGLAGHYSTPNAGKIVE